MATPVAPPLLFSAAGAGGAGLPPPPSPLPSAASSGASSSSSASASAAARRAPVAVVSAEDKAARAPSIPIVYGTISWWLGRKPGSEEHTHKWTVYVRSPEGIDLSYAIQKVIFRLHPTVPSPVREVTAPPYTVSQSGWGEFDVAITIYLRDPSTPPIGVSTKLRLYPPAGQAPSTEIPIVEEQYDEIVINDLPRSVEAATRLLKAEVEACSCTNGLVPESHTAPQPPYPYQEFFPDYSADEDLGVLQSVRQRLAEETRALEARLLVRQLEVQRTREELKALGVI